MGAIMKNILFCFSFIFFFSVNIFAQIDTTSLSYYPLNEGDYWEYLEITEFWWPDSTTYEYYSHKIIGDTLLLQNKNFKIIERKLIGSSQSSFYLFERLDTTTCNLYRYDRFSNIEYLIDSLKSEPGDSCHAARTAHYGIGWLTICTNIFTDTILNKITVSKKFVELNGLSPVDYNLSQGFGLTYLNYYFDFGLFTQTLLYAIIDSIEYGTPVNIIQKENQNIIKEFHLGQNYPNPFNSTTTILFELSQNSKIEINIYNVNGGKIINLFSTEMNQGSHKINWDGTNQAGHQVASGVYIYTLTVSPLITNKSLNESAKLLLIR